MSTIEESRAALNTMRAALNRRRSATTDPAERQALAEQVDRISDALIDLANQDAQLWSQRVATATSAVASLLMTARINPFDAGIRGAFQEVADRAVRLADQASKPFMADAAIASDTANAEADLDFAPPAIPPIASAPVASDGPQALPPIVRGTALAALSADYSLCWQACRIAPQKRADVERSAERLLQGRPRYQAVSARTNGVPWQLIGIMHGLECGYDFFKHLHNGDSLAGPTRRVPAGLPRGWNPSRQTWEDSAVDAVQLKKLDRVRTWSLPAALYALEAFNGFGYRSRDLRSPYLWSFSNLYSKGKFIADHVFDPNAVSAQVGCGLVLKVLEERGLGLDVPLAEPDRGAAGESQGVDVVQQACEACFDAHKNDCSGFVRAVADTLGIVMAGLADQMVGALRGGGPWVPLTDGIAAARSAKAGNLVVGGLQGSEQAVRNGHGHVVVVVDGPLAHDAYPTGYWGSLGGQPGKRQTINFAWTAADRDRVTYAERPINPGRS